MKALRLLFEGNRHHVETMARRRKGQIDDLQQGQSPAYVTVCCSDSRVSNEATFEHTDPGLNFTVGKIGNKVVDFDAEGNSHISGDVSYIPANQSPDGLVVMGHTGCGAITAVYNHVRAGGIEDQPEGVRDIVEHLLYPSLADRVDELPEARDRAISHLVEHNVDRQIDHLAQSDDIPSDIPLIGLVYDLHEQYGDEPGAIYLVNLDECTERAPLVDALPLDMDHRVHRLTGWDDGAT